MAETFRFFVEPKLFWKYIVKKIHIKYAHTEVFFTKNILHYNRHNANNADAAIYLPECRS